MKILPVNNNFINNKISFSKKDKPNAPIIEKQNNKSKQKKALIIGAAAAAGIIAIAVIRKQIKYGQIKKEITRVYNEVWDEYTQNNAELFSKIKIGKPNLEFFKNSKDAEAIYEIEYNKIKMNLKTLAHIGTYEEPYIYSLRKSDIPDLVKRNKLDIFKFKKWKDNSYNINEMEKAKKKLFHRFTPAETAEFTAGFLGHEIQHATQAHIIFNTKGLGTTAYLRKAADHGGYSYGATKEALKDSYVCNYKSTHTFSTQTDIIRKGPIADFKSKVMDLWDGMKLVLSDNYDDTYDININELDSFIEGANTLSRRMARITNPRLKALLKIEQEDTNIALDGMVKAMQDVGKMAKS